MQDKSEVFPVVFSGVASSDAIVAFVHTYAHLCMLLRQARAASAA